MSDLSTTRIRGISRGPFCENRFSGTGHVVVIGKLALVKVMKCCSESIRNQPLKDTL